MGAELESEYTPVEAGLARPKVKKHDFIGKAAYLKARADGPAAILCTLTVDDHTSASGVKRYMQGREPILTPEGEVIMDSHGRRSYVTSAGGGPNEDDVVTTTKVGEIDFEILNCNEATATVRLDGSDPVTYTASQLTRPFPCVD